MSQIQIRDDHGRGIPHVNIRIALGEGDADAAIFDIETDDAGNQGWPIPFWPRQDYTLHVNKRGVVRGYGEASQFVAAAAHGADVVIQLERSGMSPESRAMSRLTAHREGFRNQSGDRVVIAGVSAFMHFERYLNGEDVRPLLAQAVELGANCLRVFGMAHYIPVNAGRRAFKPQDYGDRYFDAQPEFFALCASSGLYVYWSVFPDNDLIRVPNARDFFVREVATLKQAENTFGELTNEQDAHSFNAVDPTSMPRPNGIAFTSGSYGDIGGAQPHCWDFCDYHTPRDYPKHIKDSCVVDHPNYLAGAGVLLGEPDRYGTGGNLDHDQARLSAGACRESALGMVFHSTHGRESVSYDDATMAIGRVFFNALIGAAS